MRLVVTSQAVDDPRPLPLLAPVPDALLWLRRGDGMAAWGQAVDIEVGTGPDRARRTTRSLGDIDIDGDPADVIAFASLSFQRDGASRAVVPRRVLIRRHGHTRLVAIDPEDAIDPVPGPGGLPVPPLDDRVRYAGSSLPDLHWLEAVAAAIDHIATGDVEKVVLARDHAVWCRQTFDPRHLAMQLSGRFPDCWTFHHDGLVGATPELLIRRKGSDLTSVVLAGTARRDPDPVIDRELGEALLASDKDRREHALALDSVAKRLSRVSNDLDVPVEPGLLILDNVVHLATRVTARLADLTQSALEIADDLHPTAAVGGTPRSRALELIDELEGMDRGRYAAPVGWMDGTGNGEFGLALRCAQLSGARARLFAGVGIVAGSLPEDELEETRLKLRAMQGALGG